MNFGFEVFVLRFALLKHRVDVRSEVSYLQSRMKINSYHFGEMDIDGTAYTSDLVIASGEIHARWYRQEGHRVKLLDIEKWIRNDCRKLIIGTGAAGFCKVAPEVDQYCREHSIELIAEKTGKATETFNSVKEKSGVVAAFHLTC